MNSFLRIRVGESCCVSDREQTVLLKGQCKYRALLYIEGVTDTLDVLTSTDVPVNTCTFQVTNNVQLVPKLDAPLRKNGLLLWIFWWRYFVGLEEGERTVDLVWDRSVSKADGNQLTLDVL